MSLAGAGGQAHPRKSPLARRDARLADEIINDNGSWGQI
jgi:hypothetical protein